MGSRGKDSIRIPEAEAISQNCTVVFVPALTNFNGLVMCYVTKKLMMRFCEHNWLTTRKVGAAFTIVFQYRAAIVAPAHRALPPMFCELSSCL